MNTPTPRTDEVAWHADLADGGDVAAVDAEFARTLERELNLVNKAAGFCDKHKPDGGARNCLVCGCEELTFALDKISYLCGEPNEHGLSEYGNHYDEKAVIKQVQELRETLDAMTMAMQLSETGKYGRKEMAVRILELEQSSREKDELIEKLVELLENGQEKFKLDFAARHKMPCFVTPLDEAIQLAHSKGYGKKP